MAGKSINAKYSWPTQKEFYYDVEISYMSLTLKDSGGNDLNVDTARSYRHDNGVIHVEVDNMGTVSGNKVGTGYHQRFYFGVGRPIAELVNTRVSARGSPVSKAGRLRSQV